MAANALMISNLTDEDLKNIKFEINNIILTKVIDINNVSEKEKNEIKQKIKDANQSFDLTDQEIYIANNGTVTVIKNKWKTTIPQNKTVVQKQIFNFNDPAITKVIMQTI
ncbi:hypothetical protein [Mycoplasma phocoenae]|uniref:Atypical Rib domain-containing protein n=1 Tax=Mycoplasma phocoenae TaxID=754517 RepID=A0A858U7H7_9MOLU|nr:hypothetical protein [Mycoplasma phocoenae]QJG67173.1 hypothetical protein HGG69_02565 [Mycoplasma phocoenae]